MLKAFNCWELSCLRKRALRLENHTCTLASDNFVFWASSSRVYTSGYWVRAKARSSVSSCSPLNVVRDLLCLRLRRMPGSDSVSLSSHDDGPVMKEKLMNCLWKYKYSVLF